MTPIPEGARPDDPKWAAAYLELANGLVMAGAKAKLVSRFTDLPQKRVRQLYRALRGMDPPAGPVVQGSARFFAMPGKHTSEAWVVQSVFFLECYDRIGKANALPMDRGWRLLAAFTAYLDVTEKHNQATADKRFDINQAYALLTHCGFLTDAGTAELKRKQCQVCLIRYPVVATALPDSHGCPVCTTNANILRLTRLRNADSSVNPARKA